MKKTLRLIFTAAMALILTGCYTNVLEPGDGGGGGNGGGQDNNSLDIGDRTQLYQHIFAESGLCEVQFTSRQGWDVNYMDEQTQKWVSISTLRSDFGGSFTLSIWVDENTTGDNRTATLQLLSGGQNETITINQSPQNRDGSQPQPYEKDAYTDIVERIGVQYLANGNIEPWAKEWRLTTNHANGQVGMMECYWIDSYGEKLEEAIAIYDSRVIEHNIFGIVQPDDRWDVVSRRHSEVVTNTNNLVIQQQLTEYNYQDENRPEPTPQHIVHSYANYRHVAERGDNSTYEYHWVDGNMIRKEDVTTYNAILFGYGTQGNYRTNIDLNSFLNGDMYAAMGLFGKRSEKLLESINDYYKGGMTNFEYSFDQNGRVETITQSDGSGESSSTIFTIHYIGDNVEDDDAGAK